MARAKKEAKVLNVQIEINIINNLERFCAETGMSKTTATEKILKQYLDEYFNRPEKERKLF